MASQFKGVLKKMETESGKPVKYFLVFENDFITLNQAIGKRLELEFVGYQCLSCGKNQPIYRQGFCKSCFYKSPQAGDWIIRPELSKAHLGIADRDLAYETKVQIQPHVVYLAYSGGLKVGVTRKSQVPTRWIDQGADQALAFMEVPNRYLAGITEVALKNVLADKTNWRKMLVSNSVEDGLFEACKTEVLASIPPETRAYYLPNEAVYHLHYPVQSYPEKVNSLNLEKETNYSGLLRGVKGQYLIFDDGTVFNIRGNEGLVVAITVKN